MKQKKRLTKLKEKMAEIFKIKDSPSSIALGTAIGISCNFVPTLGVGAIVSFAVAKLLKVSAVAAVTSNLATGFFIPVFYTLNLIVGRFLTGVMTPAKDIEGQLGESLTRSVDNIGTVVNEPSKFFLLEKVQSFSVDFFIGAFVNAILAGVIIYFALYFVLKKRRSTVKDVT